MLIIERKKVLETNIVIEQMENEALEALQYVLLGTVKYCFIKVCVKSLVEVEGKKAVINSITLKNLITSDIPSVRMAIDTVIIDIHEILEKFGFDMSDIEAKLEVKEDSTVMTEFKQKLISVIIG